MGNASDLYKLVNIKKETTFAVAAGAAGAQSARRISCDMSLNKDTYKSNEVRPDMQTSDFRHGVRRGAGKIQGDLSPKTWSDFLGSFCKRLFTAAPSASGLSIDVAGAGPTYTLTRAAGSFLTDGFKIGHVARLTAGAFNALNINKNLLIVGVTASVLSVITINGSSLFAQSGVTGSTAAVVGKQTYIPTSGHIEESYSIEQFYQELSASELFIGSKINGFAASLPPTGIATIDFDLLAKDMVPGNAQYFTSPTPATTTGSLAAVNGVLRAGGSTVATLTGLTLNGSSNYTGDPVVGSNTIPQFYPGTVEVKGQATAYFDSVALRDAFLNETEIDLVGVFSSDNTAGADFISFVLPRIKLLSHTKSGGAGGVIVTMDFVALINNAGGAGTATEKTTLLIQDSAA